jgi:ribosome recycling factor
MISDVHGELKRKMDHSLAVLVDELTAVRTGRASADILKPVLVEYYGTPTPLHQLANIATPDAQLITVSPYDPSSAKAIEKSINSSDLGLNSMLEGGVIRVPVPVLTQERRKELVKHTRKLGEDAKVAIRNLRRDANERVKKLEKSKEISQDEERSAVEHIQTETDRHIKKVDELVKNKEHDLMTV